MFQRCRYWGCTFHQANMNGSEGREFLLAQDRISAHLEDKIVHHAG